MAEDPPDLAVPRSSYVGSRRATTSFRNNNDLTYQDVLISRPNSVQPRRRRTSTTASIGSSVSANASGLNLNSNGIDTASSISLGQGPHNETILMSPDSTSVVTNGTNNKNEEDFNEDEDFLEFRLNSDDLPGVIRSRDADEDGAPQVIRHSVGSRSRLNTLDTESANSYKTADNQRRPPDSQSVVSMPSVKSSSSNIDGHEAKESSTSHNPGISEFSHMAAESPLTNLVHHNASDVDVSGDMSLGQNNAQNADQSNESEWQDMKTVASYEMYDDKGRLIVHRNDDTEETEDFAHIGASKGYTRVAVDDDAKSVTSMDENTDFLFNDEDDAARNPLTQLQATKTMLTDAQRIAYVGLCRVSMTHMAAELARIPGSRSIATQLSNSQGSLAMWSQKMMIRLYGHMDLSPEEQIMIEQLSSHGVLAQDLAPSLMKGAKVKNPVHRSQDSNDAETMVDNEVDIESPNQAGDLKVQSPEALQDQETLEIDVRWTLLCDLFLVLISDSVYDSRSRSLLILVANELGISELDIAQFEQKVTDALEIEEATNQVWDEREIMETRRKKALRKKYMYVGLATLGGGLVIGLSAGLLAPVIGAGLAAGFTTIGVAGTSGFLAGAGGTALVTTTGVAVGARIGSKGMAVRMRHVNTFEFRPLHNNKRTNVIVTISGWMLGKEDDVRLPFSTIDPVMGDLLSVLWEPEMLQSMGQTINILATEVLTQSLQQILGSTVLVALMASIQLPMALSKLGYLIDNPWNVSLDRAWAAGLILADTLVNRNLGVRPVTLVGFSLGARVIYSCLVELARRGAFGLVEQVYLFGSPFVVKKDQMALARSVVSGRFLNGYSKKDWILGYLFRATSGGLGRIAGLAPIESTPTIENFDCTEMVEGHMAYRKAMPKLLNAIGGWEVLSEDFTEIEDPDPERLREKQRELIAEFDEARKQMELEAAKAGKTQSSGEKRTSKLFGWMKPKKKEWWSMAENANRESSPEVVPGKLNESSVMFDLDSLQQEVSTLSKQPQPTKLPETVPFEEYDWKKEPQMSFDMFDDDTAERNLPNLSEAPQLPTEIMAPQNLHTHHSSYSGTSKSITSSADTTKKHANLSAPSLGESSHEESLTSQPKTPEPDSELNNTKGKSAHTNHEDEVENTNNHEEDITMMFE